MAMKNDEPETESHEAVAEYKRILAGVLDQRPSGTRQRLADALGKNRSFVTQMTSPSYPTPIPHRHLASVLSVCHFTPEERERLKPVRQRLVRTLPRTGRKSIYLSSHAGTILGWSLAEARLLLRDLTEHATQREFVYAHKWQADDLVIWDNRQTMHRGRAYPASEARDVRRTTVKGDAPTVEQAVAA